MYSLSEHVNILIKTTNLPRVLTIFSDIVHVRYTYNMTIVYRWVPLAYFLMVSSSIKFLPTIGRGRDL
nr:MAG TPA: hypothetical protein [Caudoviricetes sp.]